MSASVKVGTPLWPVGIGSGVAITMLAAVGDGGISVGVTADASVVGGGEMSGVGVGDDVERKSKTTKNNPAAITRAKSCHR